MAAGVGEGVQETSIDPMHRPLPMHLSPRCGARTRAGSPCRSPATSKGRCRLHGGARGSGGPEGPRNGNWRHGGRSGQVLALRAMERLLLRMAREALEAE